MGIFFDGDVNSELFSGQKFFSQESVEVSSSSNSGEFCIPSENEVYIDKLTESGCVNSGESYIGNRGSSPGDSQNTPIFYSEEKLNVYCGPTHEDLACNWKNDFYTYDKLHQEYIARGSTRIIIYKLNRETTQIDDLTGEAYANEFFKKGIVVQGKFTLNPMIMELNRFGITENEDVIVEFNYSHLLERLGRPVLTGDMMVIYLTSPRLTESRLFADQKNQDYYVRQTRKIYRVNTSIPKDTFLHNYVSIEINAQKTNLGTEIVENENWDDVYEIDSVPPDINNETPNPVPLDY